MNNEIVVQSDGTIVEQTTLTSDQIQQLIQNLLNVNSELQDVITTNQRAIDANTAKINSYQTAQTSSTQVMATLQATSVSDLIAQ